MAYTRAQRSLSRIGLEGSRLVNRWIYVAVFAVMTVALGLLTFHVTQTLLVDVADVGHVTPLWHEWATLFVAGP